MVIYVPNVILLRGEVPGQAAVSQVQKQELLPEDTHQPGYCEPQIGNYFPGRTEDQFCALTITGL